MRGLVAGLHLRGNQPALFKGRHFEAQIIVLCVPWYLQLALSFLDLDERWSKGT
jgi:hypothetical protein